ncbi:DUF1846 domain-containing protein [Candidatus Saccharibacteria bacterium]|nr:DUF1846 domain-containing protein [Candidatus Saccharibacteria bacterium]
MQKTKTSSTCPVGFDNKKYIKLQSAAINDRIKSFDGGKLYLEFGGKILDDLHASRSLPGFDPSAKIEILKRLKDQTEVIFCISARDIEKKKIRADYGISYEAELLRLIDHLATLGLPTIAVAITCYTDQPSALKFKKQLEHRGIKSYLHTLTKGYPTDVDTIVSEEGYGAQEYIKTTKPLIVVAAPGPNSGKLATCLSQLYHDHQHGIKSGYAKYELLPVWDLSTKHPVNLAYEASTADIGDVNMIDNFHLEKYDIVATSYNRDLAVFPVLKNILHRIVGDDIYYSPTDMGINMAGKCIIDEKIVLEANKKEITRRYLDSLCDYRNGIYGIEVPNRLKSLMDEIGVTVEDRGVVLVAQKTKEIKGSNVVAIEYPPGQFVTGRDTDVLTAPAAAVINTLKYIAGIDDEVHLLSPEKLNSLLQMKQIVYGVTRLNLSDVLTSLAVSQNNNPTIQQALSHLPELKNLEAHSTVMLPPAEIDSLKKLGIHITCTDTFTY